MQRIALADRRTALLDAAIRVVARDGLGQASVRAIAAEAGMPTAAVHYVFDSRDALLADAVQHVLTRQEADVAAALAGVPDLRAFATTALHGWLETARADPDAEVALHELTAWARSVPGLEHLPAAIYERYEATVLGFLRAAAARFGVRWAAPEAEVARLVLVITDGVAARWLVERDDDAARRSLTLGAEALLALAARP